MDFINKLKQEANLTTNTKGATAFKSTLNKNADLFGDNLRYKTPEDISFILTDAINENERLAMMNVLNIIDIRNGKGERKASEVMLDILYPKLKADAWKELINYTRIDVVIDLYLEHNNKEVINSMWKAMKDNSLIAKWFPSINASSISTRAKAKRIAKILGIDYKEYRQTLAKYRQTSVVEVKMSAKQWDKIEIKKVPAKAMLKYRSAMVRHLPEELEQAVANKEIKTTAVYPYEIVKIKDEKQFKAFWDNQKGIKIPDNAGVFPVCDFSGSMYSPNMLPYNNSLGLGLYFAQHNKGYFHNKLIQFGDDFDLIELPEDSYQAKQKLERFNNVWATNIDKVFAGLLKASLIDKENAPKYILIISDMEFDSAVGGERNFERWEKEYKKNGLELPKIIFWNVAGSNSIPVATTDKNTAIISGFSTSVLENLFDTETLTIENVMLDKLKVYEPVVDKIFDLSK